MLKGGTKCFEVVLTQKLEVLAILMGGCKRFPPLKKAHRMQFSGIAVNTACGPECHISLLAYKRSAVLT